MSHLIDINIHGVSYAKYAEFVDVFSKGKMREAMRLAVPFILKWDYDVDLAGKNPVLQLSMEDGGVVVRTLFETFKDLYEGAKTTDVEVSFSGWNMDRYTEFDELRKAGDVAAYTQMLHEVAKMKGTDPEKPLSMYQGIVMMKAVSDKASKVFNGGN